MKRTLLIAAITLVSSHGVYTMAQDSTIAQDRQVRTLPAPKGIKIGNVADFQKKDSLTRQGHKRGDMIANKALFDKLDLTDEQKSAIINLNKQRADIDKDARKKMKEENAAEKKLRKEKMQQRRAEEIQRKRDYLAGLKSILTPEQYVSMLENLVVDSKAPGMREGRNKSFGSRGNERRRPDRPHDKPNTEN